MHTRGGTQLATGTQLSNNDVHYFMGFISFLFVLLLLFSFCLILFPIYAIQVLKF